MVSKSYCNSCRWTKQDRYFSSAIENLRKEKDFCDVTLACGDEQLMAHKVILSACSPLFNRILKRNPHPHPLIYIPGAKYGDLQALLDFMYLGQVEVSAENQDSFLELAKELQVEALYQFLVNGDDSSDNFGSDKRRSCDENNTRNSDEDKRSNSDKDESSKCNKNKRNNSAKDKEINRDNVEVRIHDKDKIINCDTESELRPTTIGTKSRSSTNDIPALKRPLTQNDQQPPSKKASMSTPVSVQQDTPEMTERSELNEEGGIQSSGNGGDMDVEALEDQNDGGFIGDGMTNEDGDRKSADARGSVKNMRNGGDIDLTANEAPEDHYSEQDILNNGDNNADGDRKSADASAPGSTIPSTGNVHTDGIRTSGQPYLDDTNDGDTKTRGVEAQGEPNISNDNGGLDDFDGMNVEDRMNYEDGDSDTESSDTATSNSGTVESYGSAADEIKRRENFEKENLEINMESDTCKYTCKICMKTFSKIRGWNARRHLQSVHYAEDNICLTCGVICRNSESLADHYRRGRCNGAILYK